MIVRRAGAVGVRGGIISAAMRGVLTAVALALLLGAGATWAQADAPTLLAGTIDQREVRLYFSEAVQAASGGLDATKFIVTSSTTGHLGTVDNLRIFTGETNIVTLRVATAADFKPTVTITINAGSGIQDTASNALAAVISFTLTNLQRQPLGKPILIHAAVDGTTLTLTYDSTLLPRFTPNNAFTVSATATTTAVSGIVINPRAVSSYCES